MNVTKQIVENYHEAEQQMHLVRDVVNQVEKVLDSKGIKYKEPVLTGSFVLHYYFSRFRLPHDIDIVFVISIEQYEKFQRLPEDINLAFSNNAKEAKYKAVYRDITLSFMLYGYINIIFKIEQETQDISTNECFGFKMHTIDSILKYKNWYSRLKDYKDQVMMQCIFDEWSDEDIACRMADMELEYDEYTK